MDTPGLGASALRKSWRCPSGSSAPLLSVRTVRSMSIVTTNPALRSGFERASTAAHPDLILDAPPDTMTLRGTVAKTAVCLTVLIAAAAWAWTREMSITVVLGLIFSTFAVTILISFRPTLARSAALAYAVLEGLAVGSISKWYADGQVFAGAEGAALIWSSLGLTAAVAICLLSVYATGVIKPNANFKLTVAAATSGVALFYVATIGLSAFNVSMPLVHSTGVWGIAFSVFVVVIAAACLVVDFDFVERGVEDGLPKHMEWFAAFGLMVTLVWLYLEILRLLAKSRSR
jgi:uncharacterized YccA/Bax inhibitor family protein